MKSNARRFVAIIASFSLLFLGTVLTAQAQSLGTVDGFFSADDNYRHAIVATTDGNVHEIFYNPATGLGETVLFHYDAGIVDVAGFFSPDDNYRHAIAATTDGNVHEIFYNPATGLGETVLFHYDAGIVDVAGFFSPDDN